MSHRDTSSTSTERNSLKFLFWNVNKKALGGLIGEIAKERDSDIIILAECEDAIEVQSELNARCPRPFSRCDRLGGRVEIFTRLPRGSLVPLGDHNGLSFRRLVPPLGNDFLLVAVHLPSKLFMSAEDQSMQCTRLVARVLEFEKKVGHKRTIVVGDFNLNPFETAMISAQGFHATLSRRMAERKTRVVGRENYTFFYNPMWGHFGDRASRPPGTYFYEKSTPTNLFWNMFDQVLVRPDFLVSFIDESLQILSAVGSSSLLREDGTPDRTRASDHLPVCFALNVLEVSDVSKEFVG